MNAYRLDAFPANKAVSDGVTFLVSAWFLVAAGAAILTDPVSPYAEQVMTAQAAPAQVAETPAIAPEARLTIVVEGKRSSANL